MSLYDLLGEGVLPLTSPVQSSTQRSMASPKIAYVVKRYPRYSETFIVNEILAHEAAGLDAAILALCETRLQKIMEI